MKTYAHVIDGVITNVIIADDTFVDTQDDNYILIEEMNPNPSIGWVTNDSGVTFAPLVDYNAYIHFTYNAVETINTDIAVSVSVRDSQDTLVPVTSTYYVPIIRDSDGKQAAFKDVSFTNGKATVVFQVNEPGKYIIVADKITPKPTAIVTVSPEIIVI
jgi:hypothetical protein